MSLTIAVTGHRPNKLNNEYNGGRITNAIRLALLEATAEYEPFTYMSGMALGVDTIWAKLAIETNSKLVAAIPCLGQESKWFNNSQTIYRNILNYNKCKTVIVTPEAYRGSLMQIRNEYMVNNCDILVAVWNGSNGGTANCIKYAESVGKPIIFINRQVFRA